MLEDYGFETFLDLRVLFLDAEDGKGVPIISGDCVCLHWVVQITTVLGEGHSGFGVLFTANE